MREALWLQMGVESLLKRGDGLIWGIINLSVESKVVGRGGVKG